MLEVRMSSPALSPLLEARDLEKVYSSGRTFTVRHKGVVRAVESVSLSLASEEAVGLVGESGSGKSTTGRMLLGLEKPTNGQVLFRGRDISELKGEDWRTYRSNVQSVFQDPWSSLNPRRTVGASIDEPLISSTQLSKTDRIDRISELLDLVGLSANLRAQYPHELSGGMRQRVSIARAIAPWPSCVVLDEPVSSLDVSIKAQVMNLLKDLKERLQVSYVLIAHDLGTVRFLTNRTVVMSRGRMVEHADTEQLFNNPLHPYTKQLLDSSRAKSIHNFATRNENSSRRRSAYPNDDATRCWHCDSVQGRCPADDPGLVEIEPGHFVACARFGEPSV